MQFLSALILMVSLAIGAQASIIAWPHTHTEIAGHGLTYTAVSSPVHYLSHVPIWDHHDHHAVVVQGHPWASHWPAYWDGHAHAHVVDVHHQGDVKEVVVSSDGDSSGQSLDVSEDSSGSGVAVEAVAEPAHDATYLAKTRGAIHTATLTGHANSVSSINVEPAPGTV